MATIFFPFPIMLIRLVNLSQPTILSNNKLKGQETAYLPQSIFLLMGIAMCESMLSFHQKKAALYYRPIKHHDTQNQ